MTTMHTPGPWTVGFGNGTGEGTIHAQDSRFSQGHIAASYLPRIYEQNGKGFAEEAFAISEANARLIAAAPDLLSAL